MKRVLAVMAVAVALAAAGIAYSAHTSGTFQNANVAFGGGHAVILGFDRTFSLSATNGKGTVVRSGIVVGVKCETIVGNAAVLGGNFTQPGQYYYLEVVDNGLPVGGPAGDQISPFIVNAGKLPKVCPTPGDLNPAELDTVDAGDITVHAKGT
jgi:hypothetical protein